jgi:UDP-N-acetylmuramate dehydrogenase
VTTAIDWPVVATRLSAFLHERARTDELMSKHTTIGVGGPARVIVFPRTPAEVARVIRIAHRHGVAYVPVGKGSNLIVRDGGYDGIVIQMAEHMTSVRINARTVWAQGGASFAVLARKLTKMGRTGLEFGIGIPGSVGGAVRMNAGAFGGEVQDALASIRMVDEAGRLTAVRASQITFTYRHTSLPARAVVVEATFRCAPGPIRDDVYRRSIGRKDTQPIWERSFGSTFVNPTGRYAAEMIEGCGLKGLRRGGAMISDVHANFIINVDGSARAEDVEALIAMAQEKVKEKYGVELKTEVIVIGNR